MPTPKKTKKKKDFKKRFNPEGVREGKKTDQAIAQCSSMFENRKK